jgi:hypothetical protein
MGHEVPRQPREGRLIEDAAKASGLSVKKLVANAEISDTRWWHIVRGYQPAPGGTVNPVIAPALTLARMAYVVGISPQDLAKTGRTDAAELLTRMTDGADVRVVPGTANVTSRGFGARPGGDALDQVDEIDLIYASKSMNPEQKLRAIRQVLHLRAPAEQETAAQAEQAMGGEESATSSV